MTTRQLTIETYWTADTRRHHSAKSQLRLKRHWLKEAGFNPGATAAITVRPGSLTITTGGGRTMTNNQPTLADLLAQVRAAVAAQLGAHPEGIDPERLASTIAHHIAPTDPQALLTIAAMDEPTLGERRPWLPPEADAAQIIRANLLDTLWEEAARAILD